MISMRLLLLLVGLYTVMPTIYATVDVVAVTHNPLEIRSSVVARHVQRIADRMYKQAVITRCVRLASTGAVIVGGALCLKTLWDWYYKPVDSYHVLPIEWPDIKNEVSEQTIVDIKRYLGVVKMSLDKQYSATKNMAMVTDSYRALSASQSSFFGGLSKQAFQFIAINVISSLGMEYVKRFLQTEDIALFIARDTHLEHSFEEIKKYSIVLDNHASIPSYKVAHSALAFEEALQDLVCQLEHVIAYMEYLTGEATKNGLLVPDDLRDAPAYVVMMTNNFCKKMQIFLKQRAHEQNHHIASDVVCFVHDIQQAIKPYHYFKQRVEQAQYSVMQPLQDLYAKE